MLPSFSLSSSAKYIYILINKSWVILTIILKRGAHVDKKRGNHILYGDVLPLGSWDIFSVFLICGIFTNYFKFFCLTFSYFLSNIVFVNQNARVSHLELQPMYEKSYIKKCDWLINIFYFVFIFQ